MTEPIEIGNPYLVAAFVLAFSSFGFRTEQAVSWAVRCITEGYHPDIYKRYGFEDELTITPYRERSR